MEDEMASEVWPAQQRSYCCTISQCVVCILERFSHPILVHGAQLVIGYRTCLAIWKKTFNRIQRVPEAHPRHWYATKHIRSQDMTVALMLRAKHLVVECSSIVADQHDIKPIMSCG